MSSDVLAAAVLDRHPDVDDRTLALLCGDAWMGVDSLGADWNRWAQGLAVNIAERQIRVLRAVEAGSPPDFRDHDSFIWELSQWLDAAGWGTATEFSVRIQEGDRNPKRADLVVGEKDPDLGGHLGIPLIVVEVKSRIRTHGQASAAAAQVRNYCSGFGREYGEAPIPVIVCTDVAEEVPSVIDQVQVLSPDEFVAQIGRPA